MVGTVGLRIPTGAGSDISARLLLAALEVRVMVDPAGLGSGTCQDQCRMDLGFSQTVDGVGV
jgi:hypothetical protein